MYQILGMKTFLTAFGIACGSVMAIWAWFVPPLSIHDALNIITSSVTGTGTIIIIIGQSSIFPLICRIPGINLLFPDIEGTWVGTLESNWENIRKRVELTPDNITSSAMPITAKIHIKARLFFVCMNLYSDNGYSTSKTFFVRITCDAQDGEVRLNYMYENTTLKPDPTDSGVHQGAACLTLKRLDPNHTRLEGVYWTNRNWHKALNTAGRITLERAAAK